MMAMMMMMMISFIIIIIININAVINIIDINVVINIIIIIDIDCSRTINDDIDIITNVIDCFISPIRLGTRNV